MVFGVLACFVLIMGFVCAAPANDATPDNAASTKELVQDNSDLQVDASNSYGHRYSGWGGYSGTGNHNTHVTGYGLLDERYSPYNNGVNDLGYKGYDRGYPGYGYSGNLGYDSYDGFSGYGTSGSGTYGISPISGNGGYGGFGGNGGVSSYYGYNNPYYQGTNHLGHGYYNKKIGYGNIYSGITPSLVTGYRGYTRR